MAGDLVLALRRVELVVEAELREERGARQVWGFMFTMNTQSGPETLTSSPFSTLRTQLMMIL